MEAGRPDAFYSRCSGWKPIAPHCSVAAPRCALCAKDHLTTNHRCPVEGCKVGKGHPCPHGAAKYANCGEAHGARADACAAKREARLSARGWRSPLPPRRERGTAAPGVPEHKATVAQGEEEVGEVGQEGDRAQPGEHGGVGGRGGGSVWVLLLFPFPFLVCLAGMGRRRLGSPARINHFDLGRDMVKGGKMVAAARKGSGKPLP